MEWLRAHQNEDGGWGEDVRSYDDAAYVGVGASTPSQTAWALMALIAAGEEDETVERGIAHLIEAQREDGSWEDIHFTGTGFPSDFYIDYHLYAQVFPLMALGRHARARKSGASVTILDSNAGEPLVRLRVAGQKAG